MATTPLQADSACANLDAAILSALVQRRDAYELYNTLPFSDDPREDYTPEEAACWKIVDDAENLIHKEAATTLKGVEAKLWCALYHTVSGREDDAAVNRADMAVLERLEHTFDWNARLILSAIQSLQALEVKS
jgi:hypothetical protein